jgi:hypothetical protein
VHRRTDEERKDKQRNTTKCVGSLAFFVSFLNTNDLCHIEVQVADKKRICKLSCLSHTIHTTLKWNCEELRYFSFSLFHSENNTFNFKGRTTKTIIKIFYLVFTVFPLLILKRSCVCFLIKMLVNWDLTALFLS